MVALALTHQHPQHTMLVRHQRGGGLHIYQSAGLDNDRPHDGMRIHGT
jgi:hypothetical protein